MTVQINLEKVRIDGGTQSRVSINEAAVADYAEVLTEGGALPDVIMFFDGAAHWLADGFHRFHAHNRIGAKTIGADVRQGTLTDAKLFSYSANKAHGLPRTNEDKRNAVAGMLADFADWSDRAIAKHVGVGHPLVAAIRNPQVAAKQQENREVSAAKKVSKVESDSTHEVKKVESDSTPPSGIAKRDIAHSIGPDQEQELAEARHTIGELAQEVEQLQDRLAVENMDASEDAKTEASGLIGDLRAQVKNLERELDAMRLSRDSFQRENAELKKQLATITRQLKKAEA